MIFSARDPGQMMYQILVLAPSDQILARTFEDLGFQATLLSSEKKVLRDLSAFYKSTWSLSYFLSFYLSVLGHHQRKFFFIGSTFQNVHSNPSLLELGDLYLFPGSSGERSQDGLLFSFGWKKVFYSRPVVWGPSWRAFSRESFEKDLFLKALHLWVTRNFLKSHWDEVQIGQVLANLLGGSFYRDLDFISLEQNKL